MRFREDYVLGLDIGIGSIGWVLLRITDTGEFEIVSLSDNGGMTRAIGARTFAVPEEPKTKELLNRKRRAARGQRRVIRRRAKRMRAVRALLEEHGFAGARDTAALHWARGKRQTSPWPLRAEALERLVSDEELARVLIHIARHRGFRSNSKRQMSDREGGRVLRAVGELERKLLESGKSSVAVMLADAERRRNRAGADGKPVYEYTMFRKLLEEETALIFARQRDFGNPKAARELEERYAELAFSQRPMRSVAHLVGKCAFIEGERRAPRCAPTSERFRLAATLTTLVLSKENARSTAETRRLNAAEISAALDLLGIQRKVSFSAVRRKLDLSPDRRFEGLSYGRKNAQGREENPETADVATRGGACGAGTHAFIKCLGKDAFTRLMRTPTEDGRACLDAVAELISCNDDFEEIERQISLLPLRREEVDAVMGSVREGEFNHFKGTMHLSLKAMAKILPHLIESCSYAEGCARAGFNHTESLRIDIDDIRNPVVRRVLREARRQVRAIIREFGVVPGRIHVELARDVGKSAEERDGIDKGIRKRTEEKNKKREAVAELLGVPADRAGAEALLRYELWQQQGGKCAYYMLWRKAGGERYYGPRGNHLNGCISPDDLRNGATQIDHILPRSRTLDNSFHNKCLCIPAANQAKGGLTPYEWIGRNNPQAWHEFEEWVNSLSAKGMKKRNFLLKDLGEREEEFCARNLNDTRYACRVVMRLMEQEYEYWSDKLAIPTHHPDGRGIRRVYARPGGITAWLRRAWGLEGLKKDKSGKRLGDRHHALDAFIVAGHTESVQREAVRLFQAEERGVPAPELAPPMPSCRETLMRIMQEVFVSRAERGGTKGALHEETLRSIREEKDESGNTVKMLYERKPIMALRLQDLERVKDAERCRKMMEALREWLEAGKPEDAMPHLAHTDAGGKTRTDRIRRVRLKRGPFSSGVEVPRGDRKAQADNGNIVRTDVYSKDGKYYLVPVYTWQAARGVLPDRAIKAHAPESEWPIMNEEYAFCFSLVPDNYVLTEDGDGNVREGYFKNPDRSAGSISLAMAHDSAELVRGIGTRRLKRFEKYRVDRLGRLHRVRREKRPA
jgi:CRISPR-associated endonuclease Csn1